MTTPTESEGELLEALRRQYPDRSFPDQNIYLDAFTYGNPKINMYAVSDGGLRVGKFCSIAENVTIFLGGEHRADWVTTYPFTAFLPAYAHISGHPGTKGDVVVGNDVWIADGATILSGVSIGDGAVIGSSAMVVKDVPPYAIVAGNPATVVKYRFAEAQIAELLRIAWWDWAPAEIEAAIPYLLSPDIEAFLAYARARMTAPD